MHGIGRVLGMASLLAVLTVPLSPTVSRPAAAAAAPAPVAVPASTPAAATRPSISRTPVEPVCGLAARGYAHCLALRRTDIAATPAAAMSPSATPSGFGPADLKSAYALPGGTAGSGMTVAVVDAYDLPTAEADLGVYRAQYGLPACTTANGCFRKVDQNGGSAYPTADSGWGLEIALDVDMVSATCPNCHILLVETNTALSADLGTGVNTAVALGAVAVSNSYGRLELSTDLSSDAAYYNHPGVAVTAATGDWGYGAAPYGSSLYPGVEYPAASPNVVAVGGTSLIRDGSARGWTESAWGNVTDQDGAGSGCAAYEPKPSWQSDSQCATRMLADVSAVADPDTGVASYDSGAGGWSVMGGTSASSPIIASVFALAGGPAAGTYPASYLYSDAADLNDVTSGTADVWGICSITYFCDGVVGYDGPTGLGTPIGTGAFKWPRIPGKPTGVSAVAGNAQATVTWSAPASNGGSAVTSYTVTSSTGNRTCTWTSGPLSCTVSGLTNGTSYTFTVSATNGVGTGASSDPSNAVVPATVPGAPTNAFAFAGTTSAFVHWSPPASDGGSAIVGYTVTSSTGSRTCTWTSGPLSCTVSGLAKGTTYTFTVVAINGVGTGPASGPSNAVVANPTRAVAISAGGSNTCALVVGAEVECWGDNTYGQLGDGSTTSESAPVPVLNLTGVTAVAVGGDYACALVAGGTVKCWGSNSNGQLGDGGAEGQSPTPVAVSGVAGATAIAAGWEHACALLGGATVACWGDNSAGDLGDGTSTKRPTPVAVSGLTGATAIAAGGMHSCAIVAGGAARCWGNGNNGQLGDGLLDNSSTPVAVSGLTGATAISAGGMHTCVVLGGATAECWGDNLQGDLGDGTAWTRLTPVPVSGLTGASGISAGGNDTCALVVPGSIDCWGLNTDGQLGDGGAESESYTAVAVVGVSNATAVVSGSQHSCALVDAGLVECWGYNHSGQLGDGSLTGRAAPVLVLGFPAAPHAPTNVTATAFNRSAAVSWAAPAIDGGLPITGYTATSTPDGKTCTWSGGALACTVAGLSNGISYTFKVTATNDVGIGPASDPSAGITPLAVPDAPTSVSALRGDGSASVSWTAPADNGNPITLYVVTSSPGGRTCTWTIGQLACVVSSLTNGTNYTFTVIATNGKGSGPASEPSNSVTPAGLPGKPTGLSAVRNGSGSVSVGWTGPASDNGSSIIGFTVTSSPDARTCAWTTGHPLVCSVNGLTNGTPYTFTVTATNGVGTGPASDPSNSVIPVGAPGKPTGVTAVPGVGSAVVSWAAPADNGGSSIIGYTVTSAPDGSTCGWTSGPLSCTVSGLRSGQSYTFTVTATNGSYTGPASDPSAAVTPFSGATYHALTPARILDSRYGTGLSGTFSSHVARTFTVIGRGGVPTNATAVTGNLTVTQQTSLGFLFLGPVAMNDPTSSTLNFPLGDDRANAVTVALGTGGTLSATYAAPTYGPTAHVIFDVTGYFTP